MSRKLYVGNLPFQISREEIEDAFQAFGTVHRSQKIYL